MIRLNQARQKPLCSSAITSLLQQYIHHITILIYSAPQILLFAINFDENFINEEGITEAILLLFQLSGISRTKLVAPQTNRLVTDDNPSFSQ